MAKHRPVDVIPPELGRVVADLPYWFVINGNAVRCFCPYRPTRDVDFGVSNAADLDEFLGQLEERGEVAMRERTDDTAHLTFRGVDVSVFVLEKLAPHTEERRLTVTGLLATKLHAILDRGVRRDFFDLYVLLQQHTLGIAECLSAMREVFRQNLDEALLLRALTYFDDAEREAALPGEGKKDWAAVKDYFLTRVGCLLTPPTRPLEIQGRVVDVVSGP